jgi:hypothetical protein
MEFEPDADQDMRLAFGVDQSNGSPGPMYAVGEHRAFQVTWLRKHYHKLGSMLHAPRASEEERDPSAARAYLSDLIGEISKVADATIIAMPFATRVHFTCERCERKSVANASVVERANRAFCIHAGCDAIHRREWEDGNWRLVLDTLDFICQACETVIPMERGRIESGMEFVCSTCATQHVILSSGVCHQSRGGGA